MGWRATAKPLAGALRYVRPMATSTTSMALMPMNGSSTPPAP
jgi:hypothetical protein